MRSAFRWNLVSSLAILGFAISLVFVASPSVRAQGTGTTQITGTILDAQHRPVDGAQVRLTGPTSEEMTSAQDGSFAFINLPAGTFRVDISKGGFSPVTQDDIITTSGGTTDVKFTLQAASLTSLTIIGNVSVSTHNGATSINSTPASIVDVPATTFTDQGQLSLNQVLNEEPGITIGLAAPYMTQTAGGTANGASPLSTGVPSIRGGLPYETESLIDGHAISLGEAGYFSPSCISPYLLQDVEVVKGPGATSPSINYAINGTINYRTLEPTLKPEESADFGEDQYGGNFVNLRATGTLPGGRLSYAFDYVTQGTQGFDRGFTFPLLYAPGGTPYLNGSPITWYAGIAEQPINSNILAVYNIYDSFLVCCPNMPQNFNQRNELGKIRYSFTPSTALTVTWLGGQVSGNAIGQPCGDLTFIPPANYTGALPAGPVPTAFASTYTSNALTENNSNLFETEFHTPLGRTATLLLRQYSSSIQTFQGGPGNSGPTAAATTSITASIYGGVYYAGSSTPATFNGQVVTLTDDQYGECRTYNDLDGYTAEIDKQAGEDLLSLSYDEEKTSTYETINDFPGAGFLVTFPRGSSQTFQSVMGRVQFELGERINGTVSDNFGSYTDVYTQNDGVSFLSSTHTYEAPRVSLTWHPNSNESVRASLGTSIAPPYIALLNDNNQITYGGGLTTAPSFFTETGTSGDVLPETAFGFDVGLDTRLHSPFTVLSVDLYQTLLHNQFLQSTSQDGTYTCTGTPVPGCANAPVGYTAPLYITKTANLGHSEYEGVEVSLRRTPPTGWGYRIQGSLQRAFAYDLPAGFYNTGGCTNCTNLAILPNINFQSGGNGYNGMTGARVPYSTAYGEINYCGRNGAYFLAGMTYYGPNNSYGDPAFEVVTVSYNQPLTRHTSLQLSIYNLTNAYPNIYWNYFGGNSSAVRTPLVNGQLGEFSANAIGPETARLTLHVDL